LNVNYCSDHARGHAQRGVLDVRGLLAKDGAQKLLFGGQLGFALGRDLADQHVVGAYFGTDIDNAGIVETVQLGFSQIADVSSDFFWSELGIASHDRQFFDVHRGIAVVSYNLLGNKNRVLEVVAVPGHERDQHVLAQCQLAQVGRSTVGQNVTTSDLIATLDDRALVDVGVLVGTRVLDEVVDINTHLACDVLVVVDANHDTVGINVVDNTATDGLYGRARVNSYGTFDAGTHQRLFGTQARHGLTLHVGTHQGTVGVVVLKEGDQRSSDRNDLRRGHVHVLNILGRRQHGFAGLAAGNQVVDKTAFFVKRGVGLCNDVVAFFDSGQIVDLIADLAVDNLAIRSFEEAKLVQACI